MNASEVLDKAADLIQERGWATGNLSMRLDGSPVCIEGGIAAAMGLSGRIPYGGAPAAAHSDVKECPAYAAVMSYLGDRCINAAMPMADPPLWAWNDTVAQSATEVIEVLRAAAMVERTREAALVEVSA